ncbi:MAG: MOSC domain-containing protein [Gammaproteobacteria bacterium]|nr:MOSC domain-containing protein [Gammaproteobacteria bacterium]
MDSAVALARAPLLGEATTTAFADAAPFLVVNIASLQALNAGLAQRGQPAVGIERFRPNIVVDGLDAFREHALSGLQRDEGSFRLCYPCERCAVITVDPALGVRDEPGRAAFATLAMMNPLPGTAKPLFGINATWQGEDTSLGVGDVFVARESTQEPREEIP